MGSDQTRSSDVVDLEGLPHAGEVIAGKYQIEKVIGAGGMGVVVVAKHLLLNQPVAVKFLHPQAALRSDSLQRFHIEARAMAALRSEHVVRIIDYGTLASGDPFLVMEYLDGTPLSRVIRTRAPLPVHEAIDYMLQACDAMGEAHSLGIVHRDLKPGNLFITQRTNGTPLLKVLDFGITKMLGGDGADHEQTLTATNMIMGSPQYASPEQLRSSKKVDARTDIWSLGVILYYMLAGRRPFEADSMSALCLAIAVEKHAPLTTLRAELPLALQDVVNRCLEKDREKRMPDVATFAAALRPFASAAWQTVPTATRPAALSAPMALPSAPGDAPSQPSRLLSHATPEPHAATLMTRSAWTAAPQLRRRPSMAAIQAAAIAAAAGIAVAMIYFGFGRRSSSAAVERQVEAVAPIGAASAKLEAATPPLSSSADDPIIGVDFLPTLDKPPGPSADAEPAAAPTATAAPVKSGWATAKIPIVLRDRSGAMVGRVGKGGRVRISRESGGWTLVVYAGNEGMSMGWAPSSALVPAP